MCVVSMVFDRYQDRFPWGDSTQGPQVQPQPTPPSITITSPLPQLPMAELKKLIEEFKEAVAAARTVDRLTNQPDCEDPEKAKLEQRVLELEKRLAALEAK